MTPKLLFHGSRYLTDVLKPGIVYTGKEVRWDMTESNRWLYATTNHSDAISFAVMSILEHLGFGGAYHFHNNILSIEEEEPKDGYLSLLKNQTAYLYTIADPKAHGFFKVGNKFNGYTEEWKTTENVPVDEPLLISITEWAKKERILFEQVDPNTKRSTKKKASEHLQWPEWL